MNAQKYIFWIDKHTKDPRGLGGVPSWWQCWPSPEWCACLGQVWSCRQAGDHSSLADLLWIRVWCNVDATYCLSDSQRRSWLFLFSFSNSLDIRSVFIHLPQSSRKACSSKAEVINSILSVIFQLYPFLSFSCITGNHQRNNVFTKRSQECCKVVFHCCGPKPQ